MSDAPIPEPVRASVPLRCDNCAEALGGRFCAACGQKAEALRQPAHHFVRDSMAEFFGLDGRVWRTLATLMFKPGSLTMAYLAGRRQRFLRPLRVYLSSTLLFFVLLSLIDPAGKLRSQIADDGRDGTGRVTVAAHLAENDSAVARGVSGFLVDIDELREDMAFEEAATSPESTASFRTAVADSIAVLVADADSSDRRHAEVRLKRGRAESAILRTMPPDSLISLGILHDAVAVVYPDTVGMFSAASSEWFVRSEATRRIRDGQTEAEKAAGITAFARSAIGYVPTVMFLLLPLFALLMKALYARRDWYYAEHLVFGLHTHAFAFVVFATVTLLVWTGGFVGSGLGRAITWSVSLLAASIPVYFFVAQKRVYKQSWRKTVVKALLLGTVYNTLIGIGIVGALLLAALIG